MKADSYLLLIKLPLDQTNEDSDHQTFPREVLYEGIGEPEETGSKKAQVELRPV